METLSRKIRHKVLLFVYERHSILKELTLKVQERKLCHFQINFIICYRYASKQKLNLVVLYWSPSRNYVDSSNIKNVFKNSVNSPCGHQVIVKDFNRKVTDWNSLTSTFPDNYPFMEAVIDSYWTQHIKTPTRGRGTNELSTLDLLSHLAKRFIKDVKMQSPLGKSDRSLIKLIYQYKVENLVSLSYVSLHQRWLEKNSTVL